MELNSVEVMRDQLIRALEAEMEEEEVRARRARAALAPPIPPARRPPRGVDARHVLPRPRRLPILKRYGSLILPYSWVHEASTSGAWAGSDTAAV